MYGLKRIYRYAGTYLFHQASLSISPYLFRYIITETAISISDDLYIEVNTCRLHYFLAEVNRSFLTPINTCFSRIIHIDFGIAIHICISNSIQIKTIYFILA